MKYQSYDKENNVFVEYEPTEIVDSDTGEVLTACKINKTFYGGDPWHKVYLKSFLSGFDIVNSKQLDVMCYVYEHTNPANNVFLGTYKVIADAVGVSEPTIASVLTKMQKKNIIKKIQNGAWQINPAIIMRGDENKRRVLITKYEMLDQPAPEALEETNT